MPFDYPVNLNLEGRRCLVAGGGALAAERVQGLLASQAEVTVVTPAPGDALRALVAAHDVTVHERPVDPTDLTDVFLAIVTHEDPADIETLWAAASRHGVLFSALDDVAHCHFGAAATIRRGDLRVTVSTAGKAPALSKRLRQELEEQLDDVYGELVEVLHRVRQRLSPRTVPFPVWAAAWGAALADLDALLAGLRSGDAAGVEEQIVATISEHVAAHRPT